MSAASLFRECVENTTDDKLRSASQRPKNRMHGSKITQSKKHHLSVAQTGHFGLFSGHHWHNEICPKIGAFIREQSN